MLSSSSSAFPLSLQVQPAPPRFPFAGVYFPIKLFLLDAKKVLKSGITAPITAELVYHSSDARGKIRPGLLEFDNPTPQLGSDGQFAARLRILETSAEHENRMFQIKFSLPPSFGAMPCISRPFTVIRSRLRVVDQPPLTWYKDEGGRDKVMQLTVGLHDENGSLLQNRDFPLRISLCYDGPDLSEVRNQGILKLANEGQPRLEKSGKLTIKFRIEEVSKNHQKQGFVLKIAPDTLQAPTSGEVAPDWSTAITVLSKRNKRRKKENTPNLRRILSDDSHPLPGLVVSSSSSSSVPVGSSGFPAPVVSPLPSSFPTVFHSVLSWCEFSFKSFQTLEWQHVGFEVQEDGSVNLHRPLFRCPGCWAYRDSLRPAGHQNNCAVQRAISSFNGSVSASLQEIAQIAAEAANGRGKSKRKRDDEDGEDSEDSDDLNSEDSEESEEIPQKTLPMPILPVPRLPEFGSANGQPAPAPVPVPMPMTFNASEPPQPPALVSDFSLNFEDLQFPAQPPALFGQQSALSFSMPPSLGLVSAPAPEELSVQAIQVSLTEFGFPAFNGNDELMGFYFEAPVGSAESVAFQPANSLPHSPEKLRAIVSKQTGQRLLKSNFLTLDKLKEQAILMHYQQQTTNFFA